MLRSFRGPPRRQILGPPKGGRSSINRFRSSWGGPLLELSLGQEIIISCKKLTFRARMAVWETHTSRAIKTVLEICWQLPRTKLELFELLENSPRRRGLLSKPRKKNAIGVPKLEFTQAARRRTQLHSRFTGKYLRHSRSQVLRSAYP